jgi:hypothetical protein
MSIATAHTVRGSGNPYSAGAPVSKRCLISAIGGGSTPGSYAIRRSRADLAAALDSRANNR